MRTDDPLGVRKMSIHFSRCRRRFSSRRSAIRTTQLEPSPTKLFRVTAWFWPSCLFGEIPWMGILSVGTKVFATGGASSPANQNGLVQRSLGRHFLSILNHTRICSDTKKLSELSLAIFTKVSRSERKSVKARHAKCQSLSLTKGFTINQMLKLHMGNVKVEKRKCRDVQNY